jgi:hypothetical protein
LLNRNKIIQPGDWGTFVLAPIYGIIHEIIAYITIYGVNTMVELGCKKIDAG